MRARLARELIVRKDSGSISALIKALEDPYNSVRINSATALGEIRDTSALPALEFLRDNDPDSDVVVAAQAAITKKTSRRCT